MTQHPCMMQDASSEHSSFWICCCVHDTCACMRCCASTEVCGINTPILVTTIVQMSEGKMIDIAFCAAFYLKLLRQSSEALILRDASSAKQFRAPCSCTMCSVACRLIRLHQSFVCVHCNVVHTRSLRNHFNLSRNYHHWQQWGRRLLNANERPGELTGVYTIEW